MKTKVTYNKGKKVSPEGWNFLHGDEVDLFEELKKSLVQEHPNTRVELKDLEFSYCYLQGENKILYQLSIRITEEV